MFSEEALIKKIMKSEWQSVFTKDFIEKVSYKN